VVTPLQPAQRLLVVYDGHCGFCNGWVRWLLRRDTRDRLRFAPSTSPVADALLAAHRNLLDASGLPGTVLVFPYPNPGSHPPLARFAATLAVLRLLPQPWPTLAWVLSLLPDFLTDLAYRFVARHRYRIAGRLDHCPIPTPAERARFL
jgi:predicted DCC family thiol-disulfide oxidoreductase YuxK